MLILRNNELHCSNTSLAEQNPSRTSFIVTQACAAGANSHLLHENPEVAESGWLMLPKLTVRTPESLGPYGRWMAWVARGLRLSTFRSTFLYDVARASARKSFLYSARGVSITQGGKPSLRVWLFVFIKLWFWKAEISMWQTLTRA